MVNKPFNKAYTISRGGYARVGAGWPTIIFAKRVGVRAVVDANFSAWVEEGIHLLYFLQDLHVDLADV